MLLGPTSSWRDTNSFSLSGGLNQLEEICPTGTRVFSGWKAAITVGRATAGSSPVALHDHFTVLFSVPDVPVAVHNHFSEPSWKKQECR